MTTDERIRDENLIFDINREAGICIIIRSNQLKGIPYMLGNITS